MKHLKGYNDFNKLNEELSPSNKRSIRFIPQAILGFLGNKLLGIYPMLNLKWREMKRTTLGLKNSPFSTGDTQEISNELIKINIKDLPKNSLKLILFLSNWNVYSRVKKSKIDGRDVIYISKGNCKNPRTQSRKQ
jgi:hypothetical protein